MGKGKKFSLSVVVLVLCFFCGIGIIAAPVFAAESYGNHYPGGNEDFMAGALPPAGTSIFINYLAYYNAGTLRDNAGRKASLGVPGSSVDFKLNVLVDAMRYVKVTNIKLLGGDLVWHVIVPVGYQHVSLKVQPPGFADSFYPNSGFPSSKSGLGDIEPGMGIAWHPSKTFHHIFAVDLVAPTGQYGGTGGPRNFVADAANLGRNYWSFNPLWAATYIGDKDSPIPGLELSAKFMYWFNTVNPETHYVSGQEFSMDYLVGWHPNQTWGFGVNGHFRYQTTDDKQFGSTAYDVLSGLQTGVRSKVFSIGPAITYAIPHGCLTFKYQRDVWEQNAPEGDKFWLKWVYAF